MDKFISYQDILINLNEIRYAEIEPGTGNLLITMKDSRVHIFEDKQEDILISIKRLTQAEEQL